MAISIPRNTIIATLEWCENFMTIVTPIPATYGLTAPEVASLQALVDDFRIAYDLAGVVNRIAVAPATYTKPGRADLYNARLLALDAFQSTAVTIQADDGISDSAKLDAGIVPRNFTRTPLFVPGSTPVLAFAAATVGVHGFTCHDSTTPFSRAKPAGAVAVQVSGAFLPIPAVSTDQLSVVLTSSRTRFAVQHSEPVGPIVIGTYAARWIGRRGDLGPWSTLVSATVLQG